MKFEFPDTGEGVTEGEFLQWLVEEGEEVEEDQAVAEAETDKAVIDVPAPADGVIKELKVDPGDTVEVGDVILEMDTEESGGDGEAEAENEEGTDVEDENDSESVESSEPVEEVSGTDSDDVLALPKVRKMAAEKGVELDSLDVEGRITEEDVMEAAGSSSESPGKESGGQDQVMATPSVRKLAREKGIDLNKVEGSGRDGKITREDIESYTESSTSESSGHSIEGTDRKKMSNLRKATASKMEKSRFTAPHVTHVEKADVTELSELRERVNENTDQHITYLPFIVKAVVEALQEHPDLNAELDEENDEIVRYGSFDFNIAVDTEQGLLTPLIEEVGEKSIVEVAENIEDKAGKARDGELSPGEMENGTFSITNLGVIGGEEFTPIINYPQAAILGVGSIKETAEVVEGEVVPRTTVKLSLSYDHRVVDGADAARFMNEIVENLENPESLLVKL